MIKALIVYASFTGNTEEAVHLLTDSFKRKGVAVTVEECTQAAPGAFLQYDICVVATYTWGRDAELPDEIIDFFEELPKVDLSGKIFGVLGTGDTLYDKYCQSVDDFDLQFQKTHAIRGAAMVKINDYPEEEDQKHIDAFAESLIASWNKKINSTSERV